MDNFKKIIRHKFSKAKGNILYHFLFWIFVLLVLTFWEYSYTKDARFFFIFTNEVINIAIYAIIVYFNLLYLIPNYLTKKRIFTYLGLLILSIIIITPLKAIIFYFKFAAIPSAQLQIIKELNWYFLPTFLVASSSTLFKIMVDWTFQQKEKQILQTQTMQSELNFLRSQINPHFLFNTLNNLYALSLKKSDKAPEIILKLSEMLRYMLYECNEKKVFLHKEVNYIKNYLDLEQLRQGKKVKINFELKGKIQNQEVAPLLFIPFLENSFKHGLNHSLSQGYVNIKLTVKNDIIDFHIENSKPQELPQLLHKKSGGIGLTNVKRRLDILYPGYYDLVIEDSPDAYSVKLHLNLTEP